MTSSMPPSAAEKRHPRIWLTMKILLPFVILAAGIFAMIYLIETAPTAGRQPPPRTARLVEVRAYEPINTQAVVTAMGTVQPARQITLHPEVSGRVIAVHPNFLPGGLIRQGETVLTLDTADVDLAVQRAESEWATAQSELTMEMGLQYVAQAEYQLLGENSALTDDERNLVLRVPQLERAKARVQSAQAALEQAKLQQSRTRIIAPFNAVIRERFVNTGSQITPATPLATLIDADTTWVLAAVPVTRLPWLSIPAGPGERGSTAQTISPHQTGHTGRVLRRLPHLEEAGRMAQVLIEFDNTASPNHPPLLIGDFVQIAIEGLPLENVLAVERPLIRGQDTLWIMNETDELEIVALDILFRGRDYVFLQNERVSSRPVVLTDLAAPVPGMKLTTNRTPTGGGGGGGGGKGGGGAP